MCIPTAGADAAPFLGGILHGASHKASFCVSSSVFQLVGDGQCFGGKRIHELLSGFVWVYHPSKAKWQLVSGRWQRCCRMECAPSQQHPPVRLRVIFSAPHVLCRPCLPLPLSAFFYSCAVSAELPADPATFWTNLMQLQLVVMAASAFCWTRSPAARATCWFWVHLPINIPALDQALGSDHGGGGGAAPFVGKMSQNKGRGNELRG